MYDNAIRSQRAATNTKERIRSSNAIQVFFFLTSIVLLVFYYNLTVTI